MCAVDLGNVCKDGKMRRQEITDAADATARDGGFGRSQPAWPGCLTPHIASGGGGEDSARHPAWHWFARGASAHTARLTWSTTTK